jgi:hypothetical protein
MFDIIKGQGQEVLLWMKKIAYITNLTFSSIILFHKQRTTKRIKAIHQVKKALI